MEQYHKQIVKIGQVDVQEIHQIMHVHIKQVQMQLHSLIRRVIVKYGQKHGH